MFVALFRTIYLSQQVATKKVAAGLKKYKNKKVTLLVKQKNSNILEDDTNKVAKGLKKYKDEEVTLLVNDNTLTM